MRKNTVLMMTAILFAAVFVGQTLTYFAVPNRYDASAELSGSEAVYNVSTNSAVTYTVLSYDNAKEVNRLFVYYDEGYASYGVTHEGQNRFIGQTIAELAVRGFTNAVIVNAAELSDALDGFKEGDAVLITSGVLPDTVYSDTNSKMFDWVDNGGNLYWIGYAIGAMYADGTVLAEVPLYQENIFGIGDCILMDQIRSAERSADPLSSGLMLNNNSLEFSLNVAAIGTGLKAKSLGFEHGGYSSVSLVERGDGWICVIGGSLGSAERVSVSQLISSGVTASSEFIGTANGSIVRGTATGTIEAAGSDIGVHIRMGEPNIVYARTFFF